MSEDAEDVTEENERFVLVADDDPAILRLVKTIIEKEGFTAEAARDGKEAYQTSAIGKTLRRRRF